MKKLLLSLLYFHLFLFCSKAAALTVMSMNVEWFWDGHPPHEGQVALGPAGIPPSRIQVELEAFSIAQIIKQQNADIVGLVEVEGSEVVARILPYLDASWQMVFKKGRDSVTGQDVALLTRYQVLTDTVNNFKDIDGQYQQTRARPSKVLGVGLQSPQGQKYYVVVAHLISKRKSNDSKRAAQANAIKNALQQHAETYDHTIVMGDLNDTPESVPLSLIQSAGLVSIAASNEYSYEYKGTKQLIDHILISPSVQNGARFYSVDLGPISDHRAVVLTHN